MTYLRLQHMFFTSKRYDDHMFRENSPQVVFLTIITGESMFATSHGFFPHPKRKLIWMGNGTPAFSGKSRLVKYYSIWPELLEKWIILLVFW